MVRQITIFNTRSKAYADTGHNTPLIELDEKERQAIHRILMIARMREIRFHDRIDILEPSPDGIRHHMMTVTLVDKNAIVGRDEHGPVTLLRHGRIRRMLDFTVLEEERTKEPTEHGVYSTQDGRTVIHEENGTWRIPNGEESQPAADWETFRENLGEERLPLIPAAMHVDD